MADRWFGTGMTASWLYWWILLVAAINMMHTETHRIAITLAPHYVQTSSTVTSKNISLHELIGRHSFRLHPPLIKDATTRLPEFLPDGPRPFVPEPNFLPGNTDIKVFETEMALLPCTVQNLGTRQVSWNKSGGDHFLSIGTEIWVQNSNLNIDHYAYPAGVTYWNLVIKETRQEDSGLYECQVISTEKMIWQVRLTVLEKPYHRPSISIEGKEFVESGQKVYLKCNTTEGDKMPDDVDWFKDGDKIESHEYPHIFITKYRSKDNLVLISELTIVSGTSNDSGTYICRSTSEQVASADVSVLLADSSNVKRGTGVSRTHTTYGQNCVMSTTNIYTLHRSFLLFLLNVAIHCLAT